MNQDQLEATLRATLATRADGVTHGPDWQLPADLTAGRGRARHVARWLAPLAAAAAVAAVVASVVAIENESSGRHAPPLVRPTHGTSVPVTSNAAPSTNPPTPSVSLPGTCRTRLPSAWKTAIRHGRLDTGSPSAVLTDIASDGTLVVSRDFGPTPGSVRDIALLSPGRAPRSAYQVQDPDRYIAGGVVYSHWLVVTISSYPRPPKNTIPNTNAIPVRVVVVNLDTGSQHEIVDVPVSNGNTPSLDLITVLDGRVYWAIRPYYTARHGLIKSYDLRTGGTRTAYAGKLDYLGVATPYIDSPAGIGGFPSTASNVYVRATLPRAVTNGVDPDHPLLVATDGSAYAWVMGVHELGWWAPGQAKPTYLTVPQRLSTTGPGGVVVSRRYVFIEGAIVDVRSAATAPLTGHGLPTGKFSQFEPDQAADGVLYGTEFAGSGHYVDGYWQDPQPQLLRVDLNGLPDLHC
jgi:hypothetical protein